MSGLTFFTKVSPFALFFSLIIVLTAVPVKAQSFRKGNLFLDASGGLGIYNGRTYDYQSYIEKDSKAAAWVFPVWLEYGLAKRHSLSAGYKRSIFIKDKKDTAGSGASIASDDINLRYMFYPVNRKYYLLGVGIHAGFSTFRFNLNNDVDAMVTGSGVTYGLHLVNRLYVSPGFALALNYTYNFYNYQKLSISDNLADHGYLDLYLWRGNVTIGFVIRLAKGE